MNVSDAGYIGKKRVKIIKKDMIKKEALERIMTQLPKEFSLGTLVDKVLEAQEKENWRFYYNPIVMKNETIFYLAIVKINPNALILDADTHTQAIKDGIWQKISSELVWEDDEFDEVELHAMKGWADELLINFDEDNVNSPHDLFNEIINCDNFSALTSIICGLWKGISTSEAYYFATRNNDDEINNRLRVVFEDSIAIYNDNLSGIFDVDIGKEH